MPFLTNVNQKYQTSQQAFVGLQDVLKMPSRHVLKASSTRLQRNNFWSCKTSSCKTSSLHFKDVLKTSWRNFARRLEDLLKTSWKTKNCYPEDVLKTCLEDVLKITSWRQTKCLLGLSESKHGLLTNLNQCLTNLHFANLYFTNLSRIQNPLIKTQ